MTASGSGPSVRPICSFISFLGNGPSCRASLLYEWNNNQHRVRGSICQMLFRRSFDSPCGKDSVNCTVISPLHCQFAVYGPAEFYSSARADRFLRETLSSTRRRNEKTSLQDFPQAVRRTNLMHSREFPVACPCLPAESSVWSIVDRRGDIAAILAVEHEPVYSIRPLFASGLARNASGSRISARQACAVSE